MKKLFYITILLLMSSGYMWSQDTEDIRIPLIGEFAPAFTAQSTRGTINFPEDYYGKWKILFSHPADFTPVCSTEILELAAAQEDFDRLNTQLIVMSTDGISSHIEWIKSLEEIKYKGQETVEINFPIISDHSMLISKRYGMIHPNSSTTRDIRGVFIIDPNDKIRAIFFYPLTTGRNIDEIERTLIAMQTSDSDQVLTPANWNKGQDVLLPSPATRDESEKLAEKKDPKIYSLAWYLWFTKL